MKMIGKKFASAVTVMGLAASLGYAAVQLKPTKVLLVKNPAVAPASRTIVWKVIEKASSNTVIGDPTVGGATLNIALNPGGTQCVHMPPIDWDKIDRNKVGTIGFKYNDSSLDNGPVKVAQIKKTPSGTFHIMVLLKGLGGISVVPGNPTTSYALNFKIGGGDEYCSGSGAAVAKANNAKTFKITNDTTPGTCLLAACS